MTTTEEGGGVMPEVFINGKRQALPDRCHISLIAALAGDSFLRLDVARERPDGQADDLSGEIEVRPGDRFITLPPCSFNRRANEADQ